MPQYLSGDKIYTCSQCKTNLSDHANMISKVRQRAPRPDEQAPAPVLLFFLCFTSMQGCPCLWTPCRAQLHVHFCSEAAQGATSAQHLPAQPAAPETVCRLFKDGTAVHTFLATCEWSWRIWEATVMPDQMSWHQASSMVAQLGSGSRQPVTPPSPAQRECHLGPSGRPHAHHWAAHCVRHLLHHMQLRARLEVRGEWGQTPCPAVACWSSLWWALHAQ